MSESKVIIEITLVIIAFSIMSFVAGYNIGQRTASTTTYIDGNYLVTLDCSDGTVCYNTTPKSCYPNDTYALLKYCKK